MQKGGVIFLFTDNGNAAPHLCADDACAIKKYHV